MIEPQAGGESASDPLSPFHGGCRSHVASIEKMHDGYVRCSFCCAQQVCGPLETHAELADAMNMKSSAPGETRLTLSSTGKQAADWLKRSKVVRTNVLSMEKPSLTMEHKEQ